MRIGVDARELEHDMTGINRYLNEFVQYMRNTPFEYYMYCTRQPKRDIQYSNIHIRRLQGLPYVWDNILLPQALAKDSIDLFFSPYYKKPWSLQCRSIVTVHDLNILFDANYSFWRKAYFRNIISRSLSSCDLIITVSRYVKEEIIKTFHIGSDKIIVNYNVLDKQFKPLDDPNKVTSILARYGMSGEYILYVGNLLPGKNVSSILKAYAQLPEGIKEKYKLVIAGNKRWSYQRLVKLREQLKLKDNVIFTGFIDDSDLVYLYNGARLFVFPSLREGFGFPPLEAMACGIPVIASNKTSLPEILGDAAILIEPLDSKVFSEAIITLLTNDDARSSYIKKGLAQAREFSAEKTINKLLGIFEKFNRRIS